MIWTQDPTIYENQAYWKRMHNMCLEDRKSNVVVSDNEAEQVPNWEHVG
jgi:hypothetical protein